MYDYCQGISSKLRDVEMLKAFDSSTWTLRIKRRAGTSREVT